MNNWRYFDYEQDTMLACPCCGTQGMDIDGATDVEALRAIIEANEL